jgi:hypothetical protein
VTPSEPVRVLDLFCGLKGWSAPFAARGHDVRTLDYDPKFGATYTADILEWDAEEDLGAWRPDVILASPPCEGFTVMQIGRNWNHDHTPKTQTAATALEIMETTVNLIRWFKPRWCWIENPVGKMRRLMEIHAPEFPRRTVTYCQYGEARMKPTDLWGNWPRTWNPRPPCGQGDSCHPATPRGTRTHGTQAQGVTPEQRAKIPDALALEVCIAVEKASRVPELLEDGRGVRPPPSGGWF